MANIGKPVRKIRIEPEPKREPPPKHEPARPMPPRRETAPSRRKRAACGESRCVIRPLDLGSTR